jgi:DNA-binding MarR family transcriptional regulator
MVYSGAMATIQSTIRQSVSLPKDVARRVKDLAKRNKTSANRVLVSLIESGLDAEEQEKKRFFDLADRLTHSRDARERQQIKEELARMTFGE